MALFGGGTSWAGPLVGAASLSIVNELLSTYIKPEIARMIYGAMFVAVILFMPDGIVAFVKKRRG